MFKANHTDFSSVIQIQLTVKPEKYGNSVLLSNHHEACSSLIQKDSLNKWKCSHWNRNIEKLQKAVLSHNPKVFQNENIGKSDFWAIIFKLKPASKTGGANIH